MLGDVIGWWGSACGKSSKVKNRNDIVEHSVMREVNVTVRDRVSEKGDGLANEYEAGVHRVVEREMNIVMPRAVRRRVEFGKTS